MDASPAKPIPAWLRASRESQTMRRRGGDGPWTYKRLLEEMEQQIGWAPSHANYSMYERGKATPLPDTLEKFERFWAAYGIARPDLSPPPAVLEEPSETAKLIAAVGELVSLLRPIVEQAADREARLRAVEAELQSLREAQGDGASPGRSTHRSTAG